MQDRVCTLNGVSLSLLDSWLSSSKRVLIHPQSGLELCALTYSSEVWVVSQSTECLARAELYALGLDILKKDGFETLLGMNLAGRRVFLYHQLRAHLTPQGRTFWDAHEALIREGLIIDSQLSKIIQRCGLGHSVMRWRLVAPYLLDLWARSRAVMLSGKVLAQRLNEHKDSSMIRVLRQWCISIEDLGIKKERFARAEIQYQWRLGAIEEILFHKKGWDAIFWGDRIDLLSDDQRRLLWEEFRNPIWRGCLMIMVSYKEIPSWIEEISHWKIELHTETTLFYKGLIRVQL